jgi:hypothetical protein
MSFIHEEEWAATFVNHFISEVLGPGIDVFRSSSDSAIYAGDDWMMRIFEELKTAKLLVSMLSPASVQRPWINFEAGAAWMGNTKVIPVCFDGLTIETLPKPYSSLQAVEINTNDGAHYLASSIAHHLSIASPPKPRFTPRIGGALGGGETPEEKAQRMPYERLNTLLKLDSKIRASKE